MSEEARDIVRKSLQRAGLLPTDEQKRARQELRALLASLLEDLAVAPLSALIMYLNPSVLVQAAPDDDEEFVPRTMDRLAVELDRRFPVRCPHVDADGLRCMKNSGHNDEHTRWMPVQVHPGASS